MRSRRSDRCAGLHGTSERPGLDGPPMMARSPRRRGFCRPKHANSLIETRRSAALPGLALIALLIAFPLLARAQDGRTGPTSATLDGEIAHAQKMRRLFPDPGIGAQAAPRLIPRLEIDRDPSGSVASFQPNGPTITAKNAFFANLGSNGRTCFTCHQPQDGWALSARHARDRFDADPDDPLFRLVDGATCPSDDVSTPRAKKQAFSLLLEKGLIRIGLPMPSQGREFEIIGVDDPAGCNTNPITGLTGSTTGIVSVYRRPLPAANLGFLSTVMWDGREPSLLSQAMDATLGHAQATAAPSPAQQQQIVSFEGCTQADTPASCANTPLGSGVFTAQIFDDEALGLTDDGAKGGPVALAKLVQGFFIGINDPLGNNPKGDPFAADVFHLFDAWDDVRGPSSVAAARQAIARGEQVFNSVKINITGVAGLNDALGQNSIQGFCGTCHDTPGAGNHSVSAPLNIGVADAGANSPPSLDIAGLPVFTLRCTAGPLAGQIFDVTDPGRALVSGKCADIGKLKGPILRALAARAPYFHNGSAATLGDVVNFYDQRFGIGFTKQQKSDLVAFLNSL